MAKEYTKMLLVSANVGSIFEEVGFDSGFPFSSSCDSCVFIFVLTKWG